MTTYSKGIPGELFEIRDFINMVFSMHRSPHDFGNLLPKLYEDSQNTEAYHYLAKEDEKLKATVCAQPFSLTNGTQTLSCAAIGSVSVHPYSRGKGYMKELMSWMQGDLKEQGTSLCVLEGRRHRYQYFGYELGGQKLEFQFTHDNFIHCRSISENFPLTIQLVNKEDTQIIQECLRLHNAQVIHANREEDFFRICSSWNSRLYAIWNEDCVAGYLCACKEQIHELVLEQETLLFSCLDIYLNQSGSSRLSLCVPSWNTERIRHLSIFCERFSILQEDNFCILNYQEVLSFFLNLKAGIQELTDGRLVIKPGENPPLQITVHKNQVDISESTEVPHIELSGYDVVSLLFSPKAALPGALPRELSAVNWFPLPLSLSHLDKC